MIKYEPHQQRVVVESNELNDKIEKLSEFIESDNFKNVVKDEEERFRLRKQEFLMIEYNDVLIDRINNF